MKGTGKYMPLYKMKIPSLEKLISQDPTIYPDYAGGYEGRLYWESLTRELKGRKTPAARQALKRLGMNPHPHTTKQLNKMTKKGLIRLVVKLEKFIVSAVYQMYKAKLPRLSTTHKRLAQKDKKIEEKARLLSSRPVSSWSPADYAWVEKTRGKRKKKRKFSRKQLAAQRLFAKRARAGTLRRR